MLDTQTGDRTRLSSHAVGGAAWSPDASRIAVAAERGIVVLDADGSNRRQVTFNPTDSEPTWSPGGERIAFVSGSDLYTVGTRGGIQHVLDVGDEDVFAPRWSHDGQWLAFSRTDSDTETAALEVIRHDGSGRRRLAPDAEQPLWSPRARTLLYVHAGDVFRVDADGRNRKRLTFRGPDWSLDRSPSWSPDGKRITYVNPRLARRIRDPSMRTDVWVMNADGSAKRAVTRAFPTGGTYFLPEWVERAPRATPVRSPMDLLSLRPRRVLLTGQPVGGLSAAGSTAVVVQDWGARPSSTIRRARCWCGRPRVVEFDVFPSAPAAARWTQCSPKGASRTSATTPPSTCTKAKSAPRRFTAERGRSHVSAPRTSSAPGSPRGCCEVSRRAMG